jgi:TonB family protein
MMIARVARREILACAFTCFFSLSVFAVDIKIVANPSVKTDSISVAELRSVFLSEKRSLSDGSSVEPVFERSGSAHEMFLREFLNQTSEALQAHYGTLVFTGKGSMPKTFNSDALVLAYVARTKGAIGYVSVSAAGAGVKVLEVRKDGSKAERILLTRVDPEYPETLREKGIGGTVRLQVVISPQGRVKSASLLGGNPILAEAATKAVMQWVYMPAATPSSIEVTVPFAPSH